jgi:hypothetical protein
MAQYNDNAKLQSLSDLTKIPTFTGNKSADFFDDESWITHIKGSKLAGNWNDDCTMAYFLNPLRGKALAWYESCACTNISITIRNKWKIGFLEAYSVHRTARTAIVNLAVLMQVELECLTSFYTCVIRAVDDLKTLVPNRAFPVPAHPWLLEVQAVPGFAASPVYVSAAQAQALAKHGATCAFNHLAIKFLVSYLRPAIRDDLLKTLPTSLKDAFDKAKELECISLDPKSSSATPVMEVTVTPTSNIPAEDDIQTELDALVASGASAACIDAIQCKFKKFAKPPPCSSSSAGSNNNNNRSSKSGSSQPSTSNSNNPPNRDAKDIKCRYCNIMGHYQYDCCSRCHAGAPMISQDGKPYTQKPNAAM